MRINICNYIIDCSHNKVKGAFFFLLRKIVILRWFTFFHSVHQDKIIEITENTLVIEIWSVSAARCTDEGTIFNVSLSDSLV